MSDWKPVTIWKRDGEFNHIENGYDSDRKIPTPIDEHQRKAWSGADWEGIEGVITDQYEVFTKVEYDINRTT